MKSEHDIQREFEGEDDMRAKVLLTGILVLFGAIFFTVVGLLLGAHWEWTTEIKKTKGYTKIRYGVGINCGCDTIRYKEAREFYQEYLLQQRVGSDSSSKSNQ